MMHRLVLAQRRSGTAIYKPLIIQV